MSERSVEVFRDEFGVPHVFAAGLNDAYFGLGYCAAQDRPRTLPLHQLMVQGRLAEHLGNRRLPDAELPFLDALCRTTFFEGYGEEAFPLDDLLGVDRWMRLFDYWGRAVRSLDRLPARSEAIIDSYCAGVNHYYATHSVDLPLAIVTHEPATELAWWSFYEHYISVAYFNSNAFALAPHRTEDGGVWVGGDPHFWFLDGHRDAHIVCPELDLAGVWDGHVNLGFWGGTTPHLTTALTASGAEGKSVYRERVNPVNREEYWNAHGNCWRAFAVVEHEIKVKDGADVAFTVRSTSRGPVVAERLEAGAPVAYTVRSVFVEDLAGAIDQNLSQWTTSSAAEMLEFLKGAPYVRGHRLIGDASGSIGYACNAPVAVRDESIDWTRPVDATLPNAEWSEERWTLGSGTHSLPLALDPPSGYIRSANDAPWTAIVPNPIEPSYPSYVVPDGWRRLDARGARQRQLLDGDHVLSRDDIRGLMFDDYIPRAHYGLRALWRAHPDLAADVSSLSDGARRIHEVLEAWDGHARVDSVAMACALHVHRALPDGIPDVAVTLSDSPSERPEMSEPEVPRAAAVAYLRVLEPVADEMLRLYGRVDIPWGEMHRLVRGPVELAVGGGCSELRALFGVWTGWWVGDDVIDEDGRERCLHGSRAMRLTRLAPDGVHLETIMACGQASPPDDPDSPHVLDQSELFARMEMKVVPFARAEIEARARASDHERCNHEWFERITRPSAGPV
jgi:acyl-homoserine lactone acylase PvdQ